MKIVITDGDKKTIYNDVTDYYLAVRQIVPLQKTENKQMGFEMVTKSYSHGNAVRDLIKELSQSLVELQDFFRSKRKVNENS